LILWFGWYGFNSGSALLADTTGNGDILATRAGANTTLAAGAAGITSLFFNYIVLLRQTGEAHYDLVVTMNGVLAGLVSITSSCGLVEPWAAVITGALAGVFYLIASWGLIRLRLDDAVDAIPVHFVSGCWGMLATGLFASPTRMIQAYGRAKHPGLFYGGDDGHPDATLFGAQIIGILFIVTWTGGIMLPFFIGLEKTGHFRADAMSEVAGLDKVYFGGLQMGGGDEEIAPEQIAKLTKQIDHQIHRKRHHSDKGSVNTKGSGTVGSVVSAEQVSKQGTPDDDKKIAKNV
jgi:Amt family ammonium transporter